ncbi:hypothetical protein AAHC03_019177 [Spirometra sp. Aus1]
MSHVNHPNTDRPQRKRRASGIPEFLNFNDEDPSLCTSSEDGLSEAESWPGNLLPLTEPDSGCAPVVNDGRPEDDAVLRELRNLSKQMAAFEGKAMLIDSNLLNR